MSTHYSKFDLNTYCGSPYFQAQVPVDYPLQQVLQKCRAFRRLPPNLKRLATLAKTWVMSTCPYPPPAWLKEIKRWYDASGNELDPSTGRPLTDAEIDSEWSPDPSLSNFVVHDIPIPKGGFLNPDLWEPAEEGGEDGDEVDDYSIPTQEQLVRDLASRGTEAVTREYGIRVSSSPTHNQAQGFEDRVGTALESPYFHEHEDQQVYLTNALWGAEDYEDLGGWARELFDRAELVNDISLGTANLFCPTGEGGGVDATCTKGGATPSAPAPQVNPKQHLAAIAKAIDKLAAAPRPTREERKEAKEGIKALGANKYRRNLVGNTKDRAKRRAALMREFGDGKQCPCVYCGTRLQDGTLEQDKLFTTVQGGRYRVPNLVPSCGQCNQHRGDQPFVEVMTVVAARVAQAAKEDKR